MTDPVQSASVLPSASAPLRPWGFLASTGFGLLSVAVWMAAQILAAMAVYSWVSADPEAASGTLEGLAEHALTISVATLVAMPPAIAVLVVAARWARWPAAEYLALRWPSRVHWLIGIAVVVVLVPLGDLASYLTGRDIVPTFVVEAYRTAQASGHIPMLALALVVAAPLTEEFLFRGFLLRGYAASPLGIAGAIILTSAAWAVMHVQYEWFYIAQIFILGCVFGWLRWQSGSIILVIVLHGLVNLTALLQVAYVGARAG